MNFNEDLIESVRDYPVLYDSAHPNFLDKIRKDNIWIKISEKLDKYNTTGKFMVMSVWYSIAPVVLNRGLAKQF